MALRRVIYASDQRPGSTDYRLGPARLYLDDIDAIFDVLQSAAKAESKAAGDQSNPPVVGITAGEAVADEPEDLRAARSGELRKVRLALERPVVTVELSFPTEARVTALAADPKGRAVAEGIRDYVNSRSRILSGFHPARDIFDAAIVILGEAAVVLVFATSWLQVLAYAPIPPLLTGVGNLIRSRRFGAVRVIPRRESESRGLSAETRKQLIIALVSAAVLGVLGFWAGRFSGHGGG